MSSSAGDARDSIGQRRGAARIHGFDRPLQTLLEAAAQFFDVGVLTRVCAGRAGEKDAREAGALQPVLVIHRRLVDQIGERALAFGAAVPEEDEMPSPQNRDRRVVGGDVHQQPVAVARTQAASPRAPR